MNQIKPYTVRRFHALEWEDLQWFPSNWRDYGTDYLKFIAIKFDIYKPIGPILKKGLDASGHHDWVDCASGGGSGLLNLAKNLKQGYPHLKIILTDYYPNIKAFEKTRTEDPEVFQFERSSVNAMDLPSHLHGRFRTLFGAFHHFRPDEARTILQNAVDTHSPIAIFEPIGKNPMSIISMVFVILNVLLFTPFIRPMRWSVLPFIYILPIIPLYILWDGVASIIRAYSEKELNEMVNTLKAKDSFDWEIGQVKNGAMPVSYLLGTPRKR